MSDKDFDDVLDINLKGVFIVSLPIPLFVCPACMATLKEHLHLSTVRQAYLSPSCIGLAAATVRRQGVLFSKLCAMPAWQGSLENVDSLSMGSWACRRVRKLRGRW